MVLNISGLIRTEPLVCILLRDKPGMEIVTHLNHCGITVESPRVTLRI